MELDEEIRDQAAVEMIFFVFRPGVAWLLLIKKTLGFLNLPYLFLSVPTALPGNPVGPLVFLYHYIFCHGFMPMEFLSGFSDPFHRHGTSSYRAVVLYLGVSHAYACDKFPGVFYV